jgi:hypothetical protein
LAPRRLLGHERRPLPGRGVTLTISLDQAEDFDAAVQQLDA